MGAFVADGYVPHVQEQVNSRFDVGDALTEMIGFQNEFKLFSPPHTLRSALHCSTSLRSGRRTVKVF